MQAIAVTQATKVSPATSDIKDESNIMTAHNSRNERTAITVKTPSKVGMLAKTVKPATAWREAYSSRANRNITTSIEGRPATARMPEK
jgi:hypothetical protein